MNLFSEYKKKIINNLKKLEKKSIIKISDNIESLTIDIPPKNQKGDISCNAALILAKINNCSPLKLADVIKKDLILKSFLII